MQPVDFHIRTLLHEHDCVIIPGFGGLIARYASVRVHPVRHSFTPPSKQLAFNANLRYNDGLLIMSISRKENLSPDTAAHAVENFVLHVQEALSSQHRYDLREVGLFRKSETDELEFEPYGQLNFLADSFGLPELTARPILQPRGLREMRTLIKERPLEPVKQSKRSWWTHATRIAAVLTIAILQGSAVYMVSMDGGLQFGSLYPVEWLSADQSLHNEKTQPVAIKEIAATPSVVVENSVDATAKHSLDKNTVVDQAEWDATPEKAVAPVTPEATTITKKKPVKIITEDSEAKPSVIADNTKEAVGVMETEHPSYIIGGGFSTLQNAEKYASQVKAQGAEPKILPIGPGSKLHRVAIAKFTSRQEAVQSLSKYTPQFGSTLWVLTY